MNSILLEVYSDLLDVMNTSHFTYLANALAILLITLGIWLITLTILLITMYVANHYTHLTHHFIAIPSSLLVSCMSSGKFNRFFQILRNRLTYRVSNGSHLTQFLLYGNRKVAEAETADNNFLNLPFLFELLE